MKLNLGYIAGGQLHLRSADGSASTIESRFAREVRERTVRIHQRNAWKSQGPGAQFMMRGGALPGAGGSDPTAIRTAITGVSWGCQPDELLYTLQTEEIAGVFLLQDRGREERRLFHTADCHLRYLSAQPGGDLIACSLTHEMGTANIAVMRSDGRNFTEVTEGDSVDLAPSWVPSNSRELVFQSAGVARDQAGRLCGHGPFEIHKLNLDTSEMTPILSDPKSDLLAPRIDKDGTIYYIRRPYKEPVERFNLLRFLQDIVLFPFRLLYALFQYLNFFTVRYTGKPLANSGPAAQREMDIKRMMIWGNMVDASRAARTQDGDDAPPLVPPSWELRCASGSGADEVLAKGVLCFDVCGDGTIVYSNGNAIFVRDRGGHSERLLVANMIEQLVAAPV